MIQRYLVLRDSEVERFVDVVQRVGIEPFKEIVYGDKTDPEATAA
jgi:sulfite reductase (NADPH) hemoprotein beta-component